MNAPVFNNLFNDLPDMLYVRQGPASVPQPTLFALNTQLAETLGLSAEWLASDDGVGMLSGNKVPQGAAPLAQAYAGHQFGNWVPQLGDGRAVLIGEVDTPTGQHFDIQLKGSGRTAFSRGGDGRAALGPVLREFLVSEAMFHLGIPTTRALAAVSTGAPVMRETPLPGAILTRVASSHLRVGTFQYFAARGDHLALQVLTDHAIARHYPQASSALELLEHVGQAQARLIAQWMAVGFIHGVMNTDNMAISGETIDYGPCAFLDAYHPSKVFSSIDQFGRYSYGNQPNIGGWNLAQLASSLLPLIGEGEAAIEAATQAVNTYGPAFQSAWLQAFGAKLGLADVTEADQPLIEEFLTVLMDHGMDFTQSFSQLTDLSPPSLLKEWELRWRKRLERETTDPVATMTAANPRQIARNHRVEQAIEAAYGGDRTVFDALLAVVRTPYRDDDETRPYQTPPTEAEQVTQTFCGT
jgi:uncharacterized protein YdiU (UPF0061 family)